MGWLYGRDHRPTDEILRENFTRDGQRVLASATVGRAWYAALACRDRKNGNAIVTALVVLFDRSGGGFGYKDMDETMGPNERSCPERILALLSPLDRFSDPGFAAGWRQACIAACGGVTPSLPGLIARTKARS